jgi:Tfp pilus assembly protein PilO
MAMLSAGTNVPLGRIAREHRAALLPLAVILIANIVVLVAVVLPLSRRVASNEARAVANDRALTLANAEFTRAETARAGTARASTDLETFYDKVLPRDITAARRLTQLRLQQKAREHGVRYESGTTTEEQLKDSSLSRLSVSISLSGEYDDIRALLYDLENDDDFIVIDNVALSESGQNGEALAVALNVATYYRTARPPAPPSSNGR